MTRIVFGLLFSIIGLVATPVAAGDPPSPCSTGGCVHPTPTPGGCGGTSWCLEGGTTGSGNFYGHSYGEANASGYDTATLAGSTGNQQLRQRILDPLAGQSVMDLGANWQAQARRIETGGNPNQSWAGGAGSGTWNFDNLQRAGGSFNIPSNLQGILNLTNPAAQ